MKKKKRIILDIPKRGKCGPVVYQGGPHGQFCHALFNPINPRTPPQVRGRDLWRAVSARWRTLTREQQAVWIAVALTRKSRLHLTQGKLTGHNLFVKINYPLACLGRPQFDLPPPFPEFPQLAVSSLSVTNVASGLKITLACVNDPGDHTLLRARLKPGDQFRIIGICPPPVRGVADITALYLAAFFTPRAGSKIFLQANNIIDGWEDQPQTFTFVVPPQTAF
jgi:hypothetical protein